jgi:glycosyltransferase involved in cell wall biosynthesis
MISVVIPCYNQAHFLGDAIGSVRAQTVADVDIIVVDDGSTDDSAEVARRLGARVVSQPNQGQGAARNHGLRYATGEYLVFLDSDDRLLPHAFELGLRHLTERPECAFAAGRCLLLNEAGIIPDATYYPLPTDDHYRRLLAWNFIFTPGCVVFRPAVVREAGGFATDVTGAEDFDLYLRIARQYPIFCHDDFVLEYRQHSGSTSRRAALMLRSVLKVVKRQRKWVKGDPRLEDAWREGVRSFQRELGERTVMSIRRQLRTGDWPEIWSAALTLARYYPEALWQHPAKSLARVMRGEPRDVLEEELP